ncbi:DUF1427 family protein [Burkholderia multivorans]|uniref:DUF1427 family protein n=1 Tax=Burkholderia multivorans TaxID=87883 RepID=UPI0020B42918|nr:DUF1427 family protein [Burkholderia multivorans]
MLLYRTRRRPPLTPAGESPCDRASGLLADAEPSEREPRSQTAVRMADTITARRSLAAALRSFFLQANPIRSHDFDRTVPAPVGHQRAFLMKAHSFSLLAGLLAVAIDGTLGVNSAASPVIALVGLFGRLPGEPVLPTSGTHARKPS